MAVDTFTDTSDDVNVNYPLAALVFGGLLIGTIIVVRKIAGNIPADPAGMIIPDIRVGTNVQSYRSPFFTPVSVGTAMRSPCLASPWTR